MSKLISTVSIARNCWVTIDKSFDYLAPSSSRLLFRIRQHFVNYCYVHFTNEFVWTFVDKKRLTMKILRFSYKKIMLSESCSNKCWNIFRINHFVQLNVNVLVFKVYKSWFRNRYLDLIFAALSGKFCACEWLYYRHNSYLDHRYHLQTRW